MPNLGAVRRSCRKKARLTLIIDCVATHRIVSDCIGLYRLVCDSCRSASVTIAASCTGGSEDSVLYCIGLCQIVLYQIVCDSYRSASVTIAASCMS